MSELLPCPFCGCEDIDEYEGDYGNGVYCMNCGAMMGEQVHRGFHAQERVAYEQAAEAWNTRAERTRHLETNCYTCSRCSECGYHVWHVYKYCPNCGAKVVEQ